MKVAFNLSVQRCDYVTVTSMHPAAALRTCTARDNAAASTAGTVAAFVPIASLIIGVAVACASTSVP